MSASTDTPSARQGTEAARAFLQHFEPQARGFVANLFHECVRRGAATTAAVLYELRKDAQARLRFPHNEETRWQTLRGLLLALDADPEGARGYAGQVLEWEALPHHERERRKAQRAQLHRRAYLAGLPPSPRQLAYLRALGHGGTAPQSRLEASERIDQLKGEQG